MLAIILRFRQRIDAISGLGCDYFPLNLKDISILCLLLIVFVSWSGIDCLSYSLLLTTESRDSLRDIGLRECAFQAQIRHCIAYLRLRPAHLHNDVGRVLLAHHGSGSGLVCSELLAHWATSLKDIHKQLGVALLPHWTLGIVHILVILQVSEWILARVALLISFPLGRNLVSKVNHFIWVNWNHSLTMQVLVQQFLLFLLLQFVHNGMFLCHDGLEVHLGRALRRPFVVILLQCAAEPIVEFVRQGRLVRQLRVTLPRKRDLDWARICCDGSSLLFDEHLSILRVFSLICLVDQASLCVKLHQS